MNPVRELVLPTEIETLWVLPSDKNLAGAEIELVETEDRNSCLKEALEQISGSIFTTSSSIARRRLVFLTVNGLTAADSLLVPIQCEYYALEGVTELFDTLARLRRELNPTLTIEGLLLTMFDERTNLSMAVAKGSAGFLRFAGLEYGDSAKCAARRGSEFWQTDYSLRRHVHAEPRAIWNLQRRY